MANTNQNCERTLAGELAANCPLSLLGQTAHSQVERPNDRRLEACIVHSPIAPCRMAIGERRKAGRAVSMVASEPTTMIGNPHIRKNCQGKAIDRL